MDSMISAGAGLAGSILGIGTAGWQDRRQVRQQKKLTDVSVKAQKELNDYNQQLGIKTWKETNYAAQRDQLIKAGLNPGLMYGQAGAGGVTMAGPSNGVPGASASGASGEWGMGIQLGLAAQQTAANIELAKAEADKARADADKTRGIDTDVAKGSLDKIIAETQNEAIKGRLMNIQSDIGEIDKALRPYQIKAEIDNAIQQANKLSLDNAITTDSYNSIVSEIRSRAIGQAITNELNSANIDLKKAEKQALITGVVQKWTQLGIEQQAVDVQKKGTQQRDVELSQNAFRLKIQQFEAEMAAEYPGAWNVAGSVLKKAYDSLEMIETTIMGGKVQGDVVK